MIRPSTISRIAIILLTNISKGELVVALSDNGPEKNIYSWKIAMAITNAIPTPCNIPYKVNTTGKLLVKKLILKPIYCKI